MELTEPNIILKGLASKLGLSDWTMPTTGFTIEVWNKTRAKTSGELYPPDGVKGSVEYDDGDELYIKGSTVSGLVKAPDMGIQVDLYWTNPERTRSDYLDSRTTNPDGYYEFVRLGEKDRMNGSFFVACTGVYAFPTPIYSPEVTLIYVGAPPPDAIPSWVVPVAVACVAGLIVIVGIAVYQSAAK